MFPRTILTQLQAWAEKSDRKPLVLRGARQVGKTTAVKQFAKTFDQYIYLNLELPSDRQPFEQFIDMETLVQAIFFVKNKTWSAGKKTLVFIDEIQEVPEAFNILRYFYEQFPSIHVIAAGSLLESLFDQHASFPVGRVEYMVVRPVSFPEFLLAIGEDAAYKQLIRVPVAPFAHKKLLRLFHTYALIGGMPEVVKNYAQNKDLTALKNIYESLIQAYMDDVEKYASGNSQVDIIRHVMRAAYTEAGNRIKYQGFGKSNYRSREIGEALRTLEKALLIHLVYPHSDTKLPLVPDLKKSPRLHVLDTGMLNYFVGIQKEILSTPDLNSVYQGKLIEHLVGQELLAVQSNALGGLHFWVREKKTSMAEVDYLFPYESKLIPIEVKSGATGRLRSLHLFMEDAPHNLALRFYSGERNIAEVTTGKRPYYLLSLPYYLVSQSEKYIAWFEKQIK